MISVLLSVCYSSLITIGATHKKGTGDFLSVIWRHDVVERDQLGPNPTLTIAFTSLHFIVLFLKSIY